MKKFLSSQFYTLKLLWKYSKQVFFFKLVTSFLAGIIPALMAFIYKVIVEKIELGDFNKALFVIILMGIVLFLNRLINDLINKLSSVKTDHFRNKLFFLYLEKIVNMDYEILYSPEVSTKKEMAEKAVRGNYLTSYINNLFSFFSAIIGIISVCYILSTVSIWVFAVLGVLLLFKVIITISDNKAMYNTQEQMAPINKEITYYMNVFFNQSSANDLRMYSLSNIFVKKYDNLIKKIHNLLKKLLSKIFKSNTIRNFLLTLEQIFLYGFLASEMIFNNMSFATFTMSLSALNTISSQFTNLVNSIINLFSNTKYIDDYREFLSIENKIAMPNFGIDCKDIIEKKEIFSIRNVSFKYPTSEEYVLKNINLDIEKNHLYVIVGENGVGKSTLCKLLCRLYDVSDGKIMYSGCDIKTIEYKSYRNNIGVVFQDYKYYEMSIAENVALNEYDKSEKTRNKIYDCLCKVGLKEKIDSLPLGIDTPLGTSFDKNGVLLSGGESQKLTLARVLFKNSPIVILDEPSSALDPLSENELIDTYLNSLTNKTIFYVSHRLSVVSKAYKIIFIKNNCIAGFDSHENLMKNNKDYIELYYAQAKHFNL